MDDNSIMPFGEHSGKALIDVPDNYLLWFWSANKNEYLNDFMPDGNNLQLMEYIEDSFDENDLL